jgi:hypothetical protein
MIYIVKESDYKEWLEYNTYFDDINEVFLTEEELFNIVKDCIDEDASVEEDLEEYPEDYPKLYSYYEDHEYIVDDRYFTSPSGDKLVAFIISNDY